MLKRGLAMAHVGCKSRPAILHEMCLNHHLNVVFQYMLVYYFFEVIKLKDFFEILKEWGPTISTALISAISALYLNKKSISADVKAKSRINWIQKTKEQTLDYIMACTELLEELRKKNPESTYVETDSLVEMCYKVVKTGNALILEFGIKGSSNEEKKKFKDIEENLLKSESNENKNEDIVAHILHVVEPISNFLIERERRFEGNDALLNGGITSISDVTLAYDEKYISDTRDIMRRYLKIEWDIAKEGK